MSEPGAFWEVFRELAPWGIVLFVVILDGGIISRLRRRNHEQRIQLREREVDYCDETGVESTDQGARRQ